MVKLFILREIVESTIVEKLVLRFENSEERKIFISDLFAQLKISDPSLAREIFKIFQPGENDCELIISGHKKLGCCSINNELVIKLGSPDLACKFAQLLGFEPDDKLNDLFVIHTSRLEHYADIQLEVRAPFRPQHHVLYNFIKNRKPADQQMPANTLIEQLKYT